MTTAQGSLSQCLTTLTVNIKEDVENEVYIFCSSRIKNGVYLRGKLLSTAPSKSWTVTKKYLAEFYEVKGKYKKKNLDVSYTHLLAQTEHLCPLR